MELANQPSPPGDELAAAAFVHGWMDREGLAPRYVADVPERPNVVGRIAGSGTAGRSLLFDAHLDSGLGGPLADWVYGDRPIAAARIEGERIYGAHVQNDRGPLAAFLAAAAAIRRAGARLAGELVLAAVVGEIDQAPVDEFQGPRFLGQGYGTRTLVAQGVLADFALIAETSDFGITWLECGDAWYRILLRGRTMYGPRSHRTARPGDHPNAIVRAAAAVQAVEAWGDAYEARERRRLGRSEVVPKVTVGGLRGGAPYSPSRTAAKAAVYVDVRLVPGADPLAVRGELRQALAAAGLPEAEVDLFHYRRGYEAQGIEPLIEAIERAHAAVAGTATAAVSAPETSMWRDLNVFNEVGVPAACFGPARRWDAQGIPYIAREDLLAVARMYALLALDVCGGG